MGLLATWDKYSTYVDANGKYRVIWQWENGDIEFYKFDAWVDEAALAVAFADIKLEREYGGIEKASMSLESDQAIIREIVLYIRNHPVLTLTQWNTYVNTKQWHERVIIKLFVWKLALWLAKEHGVILTDYTESQVLQKVRNWLVQSPIHLVGKVCLGILNLA